jgi:hypothetical protein
MKLLQSLARFFGARNEVSSAQIRRGDGVWESFTGSATPQAPSEAAALAVTAVYACTTLIAGAIASLPMHVYTRSREGDLSRDFGSGLWWTLNEEFCPRWSAAAGWSFLAQSKLLHGDAFAEIQRDRNGGVVGLVPIHPQRVRVICNGDGDRLVYEIQPDSTITQRSELAIRVLDQEVWVLKRSYDPATKINLSRLETCSLSSILTGKPICTLKLALSPPFPMDNYEGLAVVKDPQRGGNLVFILSDDNFSADQGTFLLAFRLDAPASPAALNPGATP